MSGRKAVSSVGLRAQHRSPRVLGLNLKSVDQRRAPRAHTHISWTRRARARIVKSTKLNHNNHIPTVFRLPWKLFKKTTTTPSVPKWVVSWLYCVWIKKLGKFHLRMHFARSLHIVFAWYTRVWKYFKATVVLVLRWINYSTYLAGIEQTLQNKKQNMVSHKIHIHYRNTHKHT